MIGLDWRVNLDEGWAAVGHDVAVQGNLRPGRAVRIALRKSRHASGDIFAPRRRTSGHIFNLGHGVLPETPVDNVIALVDAVTN